LIQESAGRKITRESTQLIPALVRKLQAIIWNELRLVTRVKTRIHSMPPESGVCLEKALIIRLNCRRPLSFKQLTEKQHVPYREGVWKCICPSSRNCS